VVATPIGNLEDITLRALRILREVDLVAAEDTRHSGNLLRHHQINTPLVSVHEHNEQSRIPRILERLRAGALVALVSDAGTPGISDPGAALVRAARAAGFDVLPVPGPSAVAAIMSASGVSDSTVVFVGFPPSRSNDRLKWAAALAVETERAIVCFEAPHRILRTLADLAAQLGDRPILVGRELTKVHEEWREGTARQLLNYFQKPKGEFVLMILPVPHPEAKSEAPGDDEIANVFGQITNAGRVGRRQAVRATAERLHLAVKTVYDAVERTKKLG
jgi:16S rRNA (cytidine1402-2'-O)-methyltransferase